MRTQQCPKCGEDKAVVEFIIYEEEILEEVTCPLCGYYDSKITLPVDLTAIPEDFEF